MNILVSQHSYYNYLDSTISSGLIALGHNVFSLYGYQTNYVERGIDGSEHVDLYIEFVDQDVPAPKKWPSVHCYGEDHHRTLGKAFQRGFDFVFVRDHRPTEPGRPISFGIEERYYEATDKKLIPLNERELDITFLGQLCYGTRHGYVEKLKRDFAGDRLVLGPRHFNEPDKKWSKWTLPWAAHDVRYFETLANSRFCLSFAGMGWDCGRHYEVLASGAIPIIEHGESERVGGEWAGALFFKNYEELCAAIEQAFASVPSWSPQHLPSEQGDNWLFNREHHSTVARAQYLLEQIGMA
jgi:hypothetical protein